jgi:glycosyltransferase involved in cell wall biosynthesis
VHEGLDSPDEHWVMGKYPDIAIAPISHSQVSTVPPSLKTNMTVIYHGCDLTQYSPLECDAGYLAFIGRMSSNKNPRDAIAAAKQLKMPIRLAGAPQTGSEQRYFDEFVRPQIDNEQVVYLGSISQSEKIDFLRHAAAVLFPIQWEEHFGLVMIEAMACGTPVVAFRRGSVPEVIDSGITGYYCEHVGEMPRFIKQAMMLDRSKIRQQVESRFSVSRMTNDYVNLYRKLVNVGKNARVEEGRGQNVLA